MALPIKETPVLTGKDAIEFIKKMKENETRLPTESEKIAYIRAKKSYEEIKRRHPDWTIEL
jgi:hypothetical protein